MKPWLYALLCSSAVFCASCAQDPPEPSSTTGPVAMGTTGEDPKVQPPMMKQNDDPNVIAHIQELEKKQVAAKVAYEKAPKDAKLKKVYIDATNGLAFELMGAVATLGPKLAYPRALSLYREVKKVDPKNAEANEWVTKIETIYKDMGRPIPKG